MPSSTLKKTYLYCIVPCLLAAMLFGCSNSSRSSGEVQAANFTCSVDLEGSFSISGSVSFPQGGSLDSDTQSSIAPLVDNGSFASAQLLSSPVVLGGYASREQLLPDTNDFYVVELLAGDRVTMRVGDAGYDCYYCDVFDDLDLFLYDSNQMLIKMSESAGSLEALTVPENGLYYIEVRVWEGQSGYVLRIQSPDGASATTETDALAQEFVPGELVLTSEPPEEGVLSAQAAAIPDLEQLEGQPAYGMLMRMVPQVTASAARANGGQSIDAHMQFRNSTDRLKYQTLRRVKELRSHPAYDLVSLNYIMRPTAVPDDRLFFEQWHYHSPDAALMVAGTTLPVAPGGINLPEAWDYTQGHEEIIVAVIDTGIRADHPDLEGKLVAGYDFVSRDTNPNDPGGAGSVFHGTHVAGTIAAATDNGIGVAGVAWKSRIMPLRALGSTSGTFYDVMQSMLFAANLPNVSNRLPETGAAAVINLSLGGFLINPQPLQPVIDDVRAAGVIVVAAAGNNTNSLDFHPASFAGVVSVSAVARNGMLASYSSFGARIDVAAPGGDGGLRVLSTSGSNNYSYLNGTSMSAPHVAGVVALMQSARLERGMPLLTPEQFDFLLAKGQLTRDLGSVGRDDQFGHGLIDASKAVQAAINNPDPELTPFLQVIPSVTQFGADLQVGLLDVRNLGGGDLVVDVRKFSGADWLTLEYLNGSNGLGSYALRVSRAGLAPGTYNASVLVVPENPAPPDVPSPLIISLAMTVSAVPLSSDLGELSVSLVDPQNPFVYLTALPRKRVTAAAPDYTFSDVPAGCYRVVASTDFDSEDFPADIGELWGFWRNPAGGVNESVVFLEADVKNIDIMVGFD